MSYTQPLRSWYSTLQLPSTSGSRNRISPVMPKTDLTQQQDELLPKVASPSLTNLFKRITLTPNRSLSRSSHASSWKAKPSVHIYLKSPHVVASGELAGNIVVDAADITVMHTLQQITLDLVGIEAVSDSNKLNINSYMFLNIQVLHLEGSESIVPFLTSVSGSNKLVVPFLVSLPSELGGTYTDKKSSIQYHLQRFNEVCWPSERLLRKKQAIIVYSNMVLKSLKDATTLYTPVLVNHRQVWKATDSGHVSVDLSMPRTVWMSSAPIYVTVKIHNETLSDTVCDMKLELLRKQKTHAINSKDQSLELVSSSCETIVSTSLAASGWWKPLEPTNSDQVTLTIESPSNHVTVHNQKLIDVSFSIQVSLKSLSHPNTVIAEIPIMLVHPISMDPPPGNYTKSIISSEGHSKECHLALQEAVSRIVSEPSSPVSTLGEDLNSSIKTTPSLALSTANSDSSGIDGLCLVAEDSTVAPEISESSSKRGFLTMKKSISNWKLRITRKMSISSGLSSNREDRHEPPKQRPRISSPLISCSSTSSVGSSSIDDTSIMSGHFAAISHCADEEMSKIIQDKEGPPQQQQAKNNRSPEKSMMKFGQIKGPKQFGQQPGCLRDAGLDIRNCFNVSTATEVIQSYAAEKVEIPDNEEGNYYIFPPYLEPNQFSDIQGIKDLIAPTEKCQIEYEDANGSGSELTDSEDVDTDSIAQVSGSNKRILASSRHLRNVQRKSVQVSRDGRPLLTLSTKNIL